MLVSQHVNVIGCREDPREKHRIRANICHHSSYMDALTYRQAEIFRGYGHARSEVHIDDALRRNHQQMCANRAAARIGFNLVDRSINLDLLIHIVNGGRHRRTSRR